MPARVKAGFPPEVPHPFRIPKPDSSSVPMPMIYESADGEVMPLRAYAAIQLRVPDSGIDWLDEMIRRARRMDARR
ncbi:MAG TPA: hypothetical protein VKU01_14005 [Bryobacteraceae bacterium]|nr:hypothetical protein [Bryobacteraceae bacterium]